MLLNYSGAERAPASDVTAAAVPLAVMIDCRRPAQPKAVGYEDLRCVCDAHRSTLAAPSRTRHKWNDGNGIFGVDMTDAVMEICLRKQIVPFNS